MCVIINKPANSSIESKIIEDNLWQNSDSFGFCLLNTGEVYHTMDIDEAFDLATSEAPMVIHGRIATHGKVNLANCHPFDARHSWLFHNGVINGMREDEHSDTWHIAQQLRMVREKDAVRFLSHFGTSRWLLVSKATLEVRTVGAWTTYGDCQFSNSYSLPCERDNSAMVATRKGYDSYKYWWRKHS